MEQPESRAKLSSQVKMLGLWEKSKQVSGLAFFISPPLTAGEEQGEVQMTRIALSLCLPCTSPREAKAESELGTHVPQALSPVLAGMATASKPLDAVICCRCVSWTTGHSLQVGPATQEVLSVLAGPIGKS